MSHARIKEVCEDQSVYYLVTNHIAGGRFLFRDLEKQKLKELLFKGVDRLSYQVVDYVFMNNHFHLIIKIPAIDKISDSKVLKRYRIFKNDPEIDFFTDAEKPDFKFKIHDISFIIGFFLRPVLYLFFIKVCPLFLTTCKELTKKAITKVGNAEGLRRMLIAVLLQSDFMYRNEFGEGTADRYGRKQLSPPRGGFRHSVALTENEPDATLLKAATSDC